MRYPQYSPELNKLIECTAYKSTTGASVHSEAINCLLYTPENNKDYWIEGGVYYNEVENIFVLTGRPKYEREYKDLKVSKVKIKTSSAEEHVVRRQITNSRGNIIDISRILTYEDNRENLLDCALVCPELDKIERTFAELPINCFRPGIELFEYEAYLYSNAELRTRLYITTEGYCVKNTKGNKKNYTLSVNVECSIRNLRGIHIPFTIQTTHDFLAVLASENSSS